MPGRVFLTSAVFCLSLPWLAGCRNDAGERTIAPPPDKPALNAKVAPVDPEKKMIVTKHYCTQFKGLTLGVSTLEEAQKQPEVISGAIKPAPNPLLQPDL